MNNLFYFPFFTVKIHFENLFFLSENIFITGDEKPGFFMSVYFILTNDILNVYMKVSGVKC
ncbi:Uncharacterized protein dnm_047550 [Desulfonema magnum]|uniref:Uncharacterized protein n=1 Tax=Desulfonema magnum TaxID=45655 RepID=A0A975GQ92_9BACT|nr:Uncharacterized protein dnm_047550 [Desulfonema magnum]